MPDEKWNPWKMTTIGLALVIATALITGLVMASWYKPDVPAPTAATSSTPSAAAPSAASPATPRAAAPARVASTAPPSTAVESCNAQARDAQARSNDKTMEVVRDAAVGGALG